MEENVIAQDAVIFIQCCICGDETPAWYSPEDKPDIPPHWRGMSPTCCDTEVYVCSSKCAMQCGHKLMQDHNTEDIDVRRVQVEVVGPAKCV